jgi:DNA ligase (NAD+)
LIGKTHTEGIGDVPLEYTCELKYDGASISITYENGKLKRAVTRGDGFQGMMLPVISKNKVDSATIKGDSAKFDVRGEIVLPFRIRKMNQDLIEIGETPILIQGILPQEV